MVTANGSVNAANIALNAMSGATIAANGIVVGNTGGGAMAMIADNARSLRTASLSTGRTASASLSWRR